MLSPTSSHLSCRAVWAPALAVRVSCSAVRAGRSRFPMREIRPLRVAMSSAALDIATRRGLISRMGNRLLPALTALQLTLTARAGAQTALQLRWELVGDSITNDFAASRAAFTLTNRGPKPLPPSGWAIYYNALHSAQPGSVAGGFTSEDLTGDLHRLVPAAAGGFAGLAPGASIRISYLTHPLLNRSFVPKGPYIVFDAA